MADQQEDENKWINLYRSLVVLLFTGMLGIGAWEAERVVSRLDGIERAQRDMALSFVSTTADVASIKEADRKRDDKIGDLETGQNQLDHRVTILEAGRKR